MGLDVARGAAGLIALVLLPGILVVRAPWTTVPLLSLAFWIASWWWAPWAGRERLLDALLLAFGLASLLRLARLDASRPAWPAVLALLAALLRAGAGLVFAGAAPDPAAAHLMVWHDGLPASYVPLRDAGSFGADPHGFDALAADVALLTGLPMPRAIALATAAALGLSSIGLYVLLGRLLAPITAAFITLAASLAASGLETASGGTAPASSLAAGFALAAVGLVATGRSRSASVAAGAFVGAATLTAPFAAAVVLAAAVAVSTIFRARARAVMRAAAPRFLWGSIAALVTAGPFLVRVGLSVAHK